MFLITRITQSNYSNIGLRVNYFNCKVNLVLTRHSKCGKLRGITNNMYALAVF